LFSGIIAYAFQLLLGLLLGASTQARLVPTYWFGSFPVIEAVAVAWALSFRDQEVRLMFVLPVPARALIGIVVGVSVLRVIALQQPPDGLLSPSGGMWAGWLRGAGTPSPLRRAYLAFKLRRVEQEAQRERQRRGERAKRSHLKAIDGGRGKAERKAGA